jgi:SAM-dependent methyltransferase
VIEAAATPGAEFNPRVLATAAALARQCFLNEYVFDVADADAVLQERLTTTVTATLAAGGPVPATHVAALAGYVPLASVPGCDALLRQTWPRPVVAVLQQQLREPAEEAALRAAIPRLTVIVDDVSRDVRQHYEQNPYPRWVSADTNQTPVALADYLRAEFPAAAVQPFGDAGRFDMLVAGCGTGQQVVELAHRFSGAEILAIDLSLASLAYAARKTTASGIANVEFGQADILQLDAFERTFDAIVSTGVLHHLADPLGAWRILLRLLRPRGVMLVGLYSEAARRPVVAARALIAARGHRAVPEDIRRARQALWALPDADPAKRVTRMSDFYSTSECRDLLFHAHEIRLTLPAIRAFIRDNGLTFIGFELDARNLQKFRQRFPDEASLADLDCWDAFEADNPDTFVGMYQFWVQKPGTDDAGKV